MLPRVDLIDMDVSLKPRDTVSEREVRWREEKSSNAKATNVACSDLNHSCTLQTFIYSTLSSSNHIYSILSSSNHIYSTLSSSNHIYSTLSSSNHIYSTLSSSNHIYSILSSSNHIYSTLSSSNHIYSILSSSNHIYSILSSSNHIYSTLSSSNHIYSTLSSSNHIYSILSSSNHIYSTLSFKSRDLHRADSSTAGMLDLGGGSTQITFKPQGEKTIQTSPIDYIRSFQMFNNTHTVYLGLGLMSARLAVLGGAPPRGSRELVTPCLSPGSEVRWEHADVVYTVSGQESEGSVLEACRLRVHRLLVGKVLKVEADDIDFYAFSFYYDRAAELGLIEEETGGSVRVSDYSEAAERVCRGWGASSGSSPFLCLDLLYISTLLQELGFPPHKTLKLARTIHQVETSWALGATFHYIESLNTH
ncbi:Ectonucleoside triphosphate diphosphohydrolase 6 [Dissostichus eleginoides]|uniref:Ectonucleoside triphosphate diphosphohydrolase 6 n=1 Tax=Dissostichus eleginoides TaxID=100907 RepID=A0AAD9CPA3_DISEL|nr:Ectonucleoside triphosphate diphosphohydrolase 6 [Dissostichus eleginoides]